MNVFAGQPHNEPPREIDIAATSATDRYKLLIGLIVPRPIAWVSTISPDGAPNLAPFSFFNAIGANPMLLMFCPASKLDGTEKDSLRNAKPVAEGGTGEFVVNIVPHALKDAMSLTSSELPFGESEWELAPHLLRTEPSLRVRPARIAAAPACFECRTLSVTRTNPGAPNAGNMVIGEVVHVRTLPGILGARFHIDAGALDAIGRMGGAAYATTRDRFDIARPEHK